MRTSYEYIQSLKPKAAKTRSTTKWQDVIDSHQLRLLSIPHSVTRIHYCGSKNTLYRINRQVFFWVYSEYFHLWPGALLQLRMAKLFPVCHEHIWFQSLFVYPQVAENFIPVAKAGHAVLYGFGNILILRKYNSTHGQQTTLMRLIFTQVEIICVFSQVQQIVYSNLRYYVNSIYINCTHGNEQPSY